MGRRALIAYTSCPCRAGSREHAAPLTYTALIQDVNPDRWLAFGAPRRILATQRLQEVVDVLTETARAVEEHGVWAVGYVAYEAAPAFDPALRTHAPGHLPLVWFALHDAPRQLSSLPLAQSDMVAPYQWTASEAKTRYDERIARIRSLIAAGDVYQVNHTLRLTAGWMEAPETLFARMVHSNRPRHAAYLRMGDRTLCSASPELFFELNGEVLTSRPMKGTAGRGLWQADDAERARRLRASVKDRAENVMIVDMVRNDLGRVARIGSVRVPRLFDIERYPTLWQMTSTVQAHTSAGFVDLLRALFPAASITGAPKARAMQVIAETEDTPRGVYTGAIGFLAPGRRMRFNVAIRTALADRQEQRVEYGTGGGIVWDSTASAEYRECLLKARIVTDTPPPFELLETLLWEPEQGYFLLEEHLARLRASADYLDVPMDEGRLRAALAEVCTGHTTDLRVRLLVNRQGQCRAQAVAMPPSTDRPVRLAISAAPVRRGNPFLYHKTTHRRVYDDARAAHTGSDDVVLWNEAGEVTETTIANIVVERDGRLVTPPVRCGLLNGVFRGVLLARGEIEEDVIRLEELRAARVIHLINSVRRWRLAVLE